MNYHDFDKSSHRVTFLVWSIAGLALVVGGGVLLKVVFSLSQVGARYQETEQARSLVSESLGSLRNYRLQLQSQINEVTAPRSAVAVDPSQILTQRPLDFDRRMVDERGNLVQSSLIAVGADQLSLSQRVHALSRGLEDLHASLWDAWIQTFLASETRKECLQVREKVRADLKAMSTIISSAVGTQRLKTAVGLAKIRESLESERSLALEKFVETVRRSGQPQQLENDMRDLILQTECLGTLDDIDQLRSQKDNKIRQTLQRLVRNHVRLGKDSEEFARHLQKYQNHTFGKDSRDDPKHQSMKITGGGLYALKVKLLLEQEAMRASRDRAQANAQACLIAEDKVSDVVAELDRSVSAETSRQIGQASNSLFGIAGMAGVGFLIACSWIVRIVSRTMIQAQYQQKASAELARIIRDSPEEVYIFSCENWKFVEVNQGAQASIGYSRNELLELTPIDLKPEINEAQFRELIDPLQLGEVTSLEFQTHHCRKDGSLYPVRISLHTATYHDEQVFVAFVADISMVQELEHKLSQAQKLESVGQLAAGVAHEINTPMQFVTDNVSFVGDYWGSIVEAIDTCEELLTSDKAIPWQQRKSRVDDLLSDRRFSHARKEIGPALEECVEGCERVVRIVRAMKEFSHPGNQEKAFACVNELVESTVTIARNRWKQYATVELDLDPNVPEAPLLVSELNQVLLNLVVNASDAIAERFADQDVLGEIRIRTYHDEHFVVIEVEDNGNGIPEEIRAKVFDPFFTTKDVGKGTGQGLAISQNVVINQHGGEMDMRTEVGQGTTFIVRLPIEDAFQQDLPRAEESSERELEAAGLI